MSLDLHSISPAPAYLFHNQQAEMQVQPLDPNTEIQFSKAVISLLPTLEGGETISFGDIFFTAVFSGECGPEEFSVFNPAPTLATPINNHPQLGLDYVAFAAFPDQLTITARRLSTDLDFSPDLASETAVDTVSLTSANNPSPWAEVQTTPKVLQYYFYYPKLQHLDDLVTRVPLHNNAISA